MLYESGNCFGAIVFGVTSLGLGELGARDRIVGHSVAHELGEASRLDTPVPIDRKAVTMDLHRVTVDKDVALHQGQVDIESFGIPGESSRQVGCRNARQTSLLLG